MQQISRMHISPRLSTLFYSSKQVISHWCKRHKHKGLILAGGTLVWNLIKLGLEGSLRSMRLEEVGAGKKGAREEDVGVSLSRASSFFLPNAFCYAG